MIDAAFRETMREVFREVLREELGRKTEAVPTPAQLRMKSGLSVEQLAAVIGVSRDTVYRYERGQLDSLDHKLAARQIERISLAIGTSADAYRQAVQSQMK